VGSLGRRRHATLPLTISSRCLLPDSSMDRPIRLSGPPRRILIGTQSNGTVENGLYCSDSADTFSDDSNYEYGDDDDYDVETFGVGAPPLPPAAAAANDDAALEYDHVRLMNEEAFAFMISRAQQARIYAAHAARAPEYTPEP
jgi:hypothetical protein